ncbi:MAG: FG-GAP repeat protein, partial [Anaerolineae bacterium]
YDVYIPLALLNHSGSSIPGTLLGYTPPDADFNGDGFADVAIGVPGEGVSGYSDAGAVNVIYGTESGLSAANDQILTQNDTPSAVPEQDDAFGYALAAGDFDGNGCTDLAVGVPSESIGTIDDAGAVYVFYGTPAADGLDTSTVQPWYQDLSDLQNSSEAFDNFGRALGAGDFNGDGYSDLVIGVPFEEVAGYSVAGAFHVLYGSPSGLSATGDQLFSQSNLINELEANDEFGSAFATGDFDGDGYQDLAIGAPGEDVDSATDSGAVYALFGSSTGLSAANYFTLLSSVTDEHFGSSLAAGDFDADGYTDLIAGAPNNSQIATNAGQITILYGADFGLAYDSDLNQGGEAATDEYFGAALTVGDYNADGAADLVIGVPGESFIADSAGALQVFYGVAGTGLPSSYDQEFQQRNLNEDSAEANDEFGYALTSGDYDGSGSSDLVVGVPFENVESVSANLAGGVHTVYSSEGAGPLQLTGLDSRFWTQDSTGIGGMVEAFDYFGQALR